MNTAWFRFYEELNDFLPAARRKIEFPYDFEGNPSVKDLIESLGVPHPEIDLIIVNGESSSFSRKITDGDHISVYPVFESLDISGIQHLRKEPLRETRFILDVHLGKLAKYLRLFGFDSLLDMNLNDNEIIERSIQEKRIILTRDKMLLRNKLVTHGYWIRSDNPRLQAEEVVRKFDLTGRMKPLNRCLECNTIIEPVSKELISGRIPDNTRKYYDEFWICKGCGRIYWEGSHYEKLIDFVESVKKGGVGRRNGEGESRRRENQK
ncbi:MAG TPA: Mut7-C RNAse domain-containing protein [Bacteroidales bacterium]|nr:Mut7-C RNAse domain-containing protein [Bacteroidales bacterium]